MNMVAKMLYTSGEPDVFYADMTMTTVGPNIVEPHPQLLGQRFHVNALFLCHSNELSTMFFHPKHLSIKIGTDSGSKPDRAGHELSHLCWVGLLVEITFGLSSHRIFEYNHHNRPIHARGDVSQMDDDVRVLKSTLDAEDVRSSSEHTTASNS